MKTPRLAARSASGKQANVEECRRHFLRYFPKGFRDPQYLAWERDYKWAAHEAWQQELGRSAFRTLLAEENYAEIAQRAVRIESRTNLLFSFEKMALRDAVRTSKGARLFADGLDALLHGAGDLQARFTHWCESVAALPRRQTRVLTWPLATVFGFLAEPNEHCFLKPKVTRQAAKRYGYDFAYQSRPNAETYLAYLAFCARVRRDLRDLKPRDYIDLQSFLWTLGSDEYPARRRRPERPLQAR